MRRRGASSGTRPRALHGGMWAISRFRVIPTASRAIAVGGELSPRDSRPTSAIRANPHTKASRRKVDFVKAIGVFRTVSEPQMRGEWPAGVQKSCLRVPQNTPRYLTPVTTPESLAIPALDCADGLTDREVYEARERQMAAFHLARWAELRAVSAWSTDTRIRSFACRVSFDPSPFRRKGPWKCRPDACRACISLRASRNLDENCNGVLVAEEHPCHEARDHRPCAGGQRSGWSIALPRRSGRRLWRSPEEREQLFPLARHLGTPDQIFHFACEGGCGRFGGPLRAPAPFALVGRQALAT